MFVLRAATKEAKAVESFGQNKNKKPNSSLDLDAQSDAYDPKHHIKGEDSSRHRGWLVLVWASVAPTPPEKPEKGERAFAELAGDELLLRRERGGEIVSRVDLRGSEIQLCRAPGKWDEEDEQTGKKKHTRHGNGAEKRWWKRLPIVVSHETRALHRGHKVLWCYALSDAAKEAWTVALWKNRTGVECGSRSHGSASSLAQTSRARSLTKDVDAFARYLVESALVEEKKLSRTSSGNSGSSSTGENPSSDVSDVAWNSGGAAGAMINALASRIFFDMQRSPEKIAEVTEQLSGLCSGIPDLPRFVGPISVSNVHLGKNTPQVLAARLPPAAKPGTSQAPWDGGSLAGRGACASCELDVDFGGTAEMTLTTHLDLSVYAEMMAEGGEGMEGGDLGDASDTDGSRNVEDVVPSSSDPSEQLKRFKSLAKKNASKLIGAVARKLVGVPISMTVKIKKLNGVVRVWIPPPPGDRLWFGFVGDPELDMEATPSFGQIGIKWHGLAKKVSEMITKNLKREIHAALVLPNGGNLIMDPLTAFTEVPELSVAELLDFGKGSMTTMRDRGKDAEVYSKAAKPSSFHTPNASLTAELEDIALTLAEDGGAKPSEDDAETAVAAMVDSCISVGEEADDLNDDDQKRDKPFDEWTSPSPGMKFETSKERKSPPESPTSPGGGRMIDFHFGKPDPRDERRRNGNGAASGAGSKDTSESSSSRSMSSQSPTSVPDQNPFENKFKQMAGVFAAKAKAMRKDVNSVHQGVLAGGMKGGLDVAKSIAQRTVTEVKKEMEKGD